MTPRGFLRLFSDQYAMLSKHLGYELLVENCFPEAVKNYTEAIYKKQAGIYQEAYDQAFSKFLYKLDLPEETRLDIIVSKSYFDKHFCKNTLPPELEDLI
jgi:hypothetical protein